MGRPSSGGDPVNAVYAICALGFPLALLLLLDQLAERIPAIGRAFDRLFPN